MTQKYIHCSYDHVQYSCEYIADTLKSDVELVVGLSRGGLVPGVILSHLLSKPFVPIAYSSSKGNGDKHHTDLVGLSELLPTNKECVAGTKPKILLVDDIADTGFTLQEICQHYSKNYTITVAVLHHSADSVFKPCICANTCEADEWVVYPWESE